MLASSSRALSPPRSTISSAHGSSSPVQIKKVVVEGRSKHDGASLRMYIKLSVAVDNTQPGASIPLFPGEYNEYLVVHEIYPSDSPENKVRITQSKVHPLDDRSVPYHFSATEQPLLQKTAIALQLGPKSSRSYHTLFPQLSPPQDPIVLASSRRGREGHSSNSVPPQNDERYTGYILVSGYNVTLVLPKEFPPKSQTTAAGAESDVDEGPVKDVQSPWLSRSARRSSSFFHKNYLHMMAGIELFIPYVLTPPKGPFLISIPVPRCLDNHLKLRISTPPVGSPPPSIPRGSFTSTSSEDDTPGWDFLTDPPVSRKFDKSIRRTPYRQSADDEQSDTPSVPSTPGTELIQGAYQSTDALHVRWAPPLGKRSAISKAEDGMRRVNIERTLGKMKSEILGRDRHSVTLGITYNGVCTGLWHSGVATILCMDVVLDVKGRRVSWIEDNMAGWAVSGNDAFGGLSSDASAPSSLSRKSSFDSGSSTFLPSLASKSPISPARGSASLLRAPLPNESAPDYSFENSPNAPSTLRSSSKQSAAVTNQETTMSRPNVPPGKPVTLIVNLLKLLPPAKNEISFSIQGIVRIDIEEEDFVPLPTFHMIGSDQERVDNVISSQSTDTIVQVGSQVESTPRRTLRVGEEVRCEDGVGLVFRSWETPAGPSSSPSTSNVGARQVTSLRSPNLPHGEVVPNAVTTTSSRSKQPSHLPCITTTVTPLVNSPQHTHCVRMNIPVYSLDGDNIEFGLALPQQSALTKVPVVDMLYASFAGRLVPVELRLRGAPSRPSISDIPAESQIIGEMQFLVIVHLEDIEADTGPVEVVYLVGEEPGVPRSFATKNKGKGKEDLDLDVLLPCFQLPVTQYQVEIDCPSDFTPHVKYSTLPNRHVNQTGIPKLMHFRLAAGFFPTLSLSLAPSENNFQSRRWTPRRVTSAVYSAVAHLTFLTLVYLVVSMGSEVRQVRDTMQAAAQALANGVPYSDVYWGSGGDPFGNDRWWTPEQFMSTANTESSTATSVTSGQTEIVHLVTPTINLAEATPRLEKRPQTTAVRGNNAGALIPAVPFLSLKLPISTKTKELIVKGLMKVWYIVRKAWNFPVDPD